MILDMESLEPEETSEEEINRTPSPPKRATKKQTRTASPRAKTRTSSPKPKRMASPPTSPRNKKVKEEKRYEWLETIRDENKRLPSDPNYDPRTLFIPESVFKTLSPFEAQFWRVKQQHFDTVVFFKKGKFYELYEMDAGV